MYLRDKQAFRKEGGAMRLAGKPIDIAKAHKQDGVKLIHIVDLDALSGIPKNLDVYDNLTFIINVQVECAPKAEMVMKLLSLKCRVVLPPSFDASGLREKKLLVAKIPKGYAGDAGGFHDVVLEDADAASVMRFDSLGKRVIVYEEAFARLDAGCRTLVWGVISSS
jgi:hypothetical protein